MRHASFSRLLIGFILFLPLGFTHPAFSNPIQEEYNEIRAAEQEIERLHAQLMTDHFTSGDFYLNIASPLEHREPLNEDYLNSWEARSSAFIGQRTKMIERKQNFFIPLLNASLHHEVDLQENSKKGLSRSQKKAVTLLNAAYLDWSRAKTVIGEDAHPKYQNKRMYGINHFLAAARELMISLGKADPLPEVVNPDEKVRKAGRNGTAKKAASVVGSMVWRNCVSCMSCSESEPEENCTPFTGPEGITALFQKLADWKGYHVSVEGQENLAEIPLNGIPNRKIVNLFLPAHRNALVDAMAMARIGLPHFLIFANPAAFMPTSFLGKMLASQGEFISVGSIKGFKPLTTPQKFLKSLQARISPNALNYPHGLVSNMGEILPITPTFVSALIQPLLVAGYEVNIIPIAYETDSRALSHTGQVEGLCFTGEIDDRNVTVKILKPLMHDAVKVLVAKQMKAKEEKRDGKYIDHFLNTVWYDNLIRHKELTLDQLLDRAEKNLKVSFSQIVKGDVGLAPGAPVLDQAANPGGVMDEEEIPMPVFHEESEEEFPMSVLAQ